MAKKKKKLTETTIEDYYDLKVDKVDELVAALTDDGTLDSDEEIDYGMNTNMGVYDPQNVKSSGKQKQFDPYKTDFLAKVPAWLKAIFVKFWFAGMVCFFFMFGIGLQDLDAVVLIGIVLGVVVDVLVNPLFRFMETDRHEYNAYMMFPFPFKAIWTFFANVFYYLIISICINYCYFGVNELLNVIKGTADTYYLGVEPLSFGLFAVTVDMIFIGLKDGIVCLVRHIKKGKKENALNV